jgi:hypothetical protein
MTFKQAGEIFQLFLIFGVAFIIPMLGWSFTIWMVLMMALRRRWPIVPPRLRVMAEIIYGVLIPLIYFGLCLPFMRLGLVKK